MTLQQAQCDSGLHFSVVSRLIPYDMYNEHVQYVYLSHNKCGAQSLTENLSY